MTEHPVGATWEARDPRGYVGRVWLDARHENGRERWLWEILGPDGGRKCGDWFPTWRGAIAECRIYLRAGGRPTLLDLVGLGREEFSPTFRRVEAVRDA